jgi:hypothetical protein
VIRQSVLLLASAAFGVMSGLAAQESGGFWSREQVREAVQPVLDQKPALAGVQLLDAAVEGDVITLNLSRQLLSLGKGAALETALRQMASAVASSPADAGGFRLRILVEGQALRDARGESPRPGSPLTRSAKARRETQSGPGASVLVLNPALDGESTEGTLSAEVTMSVRESLLSQGLEVLSTRNLDKYAGKGESGLAKWQEPALAYLRELGVPEEILATGEDASRPYFANWAGAGAMITLRAGGSGVPVIFYSGEGEFAAQSLEFATEMQANLAGSRIVECADCAMETRLAEMPGVVLDLGAASADPEAQLAGTKAVREALSPMAITGPLSATKAEMVSPAPGSQLTGATATFQWNAGSGATNYWLMVAPFLGGNTIYSQDQGTLTSVSVTGIPTDGRLIYVRLWSYIDGQWVSNDYTYRAFSAGGATPTKAALTSPAAGSTLPGATANFQWNAGVGVARYYLFAGAYPGGNNFYGADQNLATQASVTGLPVDGTTVYVRLWSYIDGVWQFNDYTFTAAGNVTPTKAAITSPAPGSTLSGTAVTFTWNSGSAVTRYFLHVGLWQGGNTLFSQDMVNATSAGVSGLPNDASTVYVRLWSYINGAWQFNDYTYTASGTAPAAAKAEMTSPAAGSTLGGTSVTFQWTKGSAAQRYWLMVGTSVGNNDIYGGDQNLNQSVLVTVPANGKPLYVRLWSYINSAWQYNDYTYRAAGQ